MTCSPLKRTATIRSQGVNNEQEQLAAKRDRTRDSLFFRQLFEAFSQQLDLARMRERTTVEAVETVTKEYDTSRPADTTTGRPPLLRETHQRRQRTDTLRDASRLQQTLTHQLSAAEEGAIVENEHLQLTAAADRHATVSTDMQTEQHRGMAWWQKSLCIVGLLTLLSVLYRIFKNK